MKKVSIAAVAAGALLFAPTIATATEAEPVTSYQPQVSWSCEEGLTAAHPLFEHAGTQTIADQLFLTVTLDGVAGDETPVGFGEVTSIDAGEAANAVIRFRVSYPEGKPFQIHQVGQTRVAAPDCSVIEEPEAPEVEGPTKPDIIRTGIEEPMNNGSWIALAAVAGALAVSGAGYAVKARSQR